MNMNKIPTPESDASTFDPYTWNQSGPGRSCSPEVMYQIDDGEWVHVDKMRDLERRLTIAREALQAVSDAGGNYCDLLTSQEIAEKALTQTEPNQ